jgi:hypothetical protein
VFVRRKREEIDDDNERLRLPHARGSHSWSDWYFIDPAADARYEELEADMATGAAGGRPQGGGPSRRRQRGLLYEVAVSNGPEGERVVFYVGFGPLRRFATYTLLGYGPFVDCRGGVAQLQRRKQQFWMWLQAHGCCFHYRFALLLTPEAAQDREDYILARVDYGSNKVKNGNYRFADIAALVRPDLTV